MSVPADKKNGKLTGRFRVEVQRQGKRLRGRFNTIEEARKKEAEWNVQLARAVFEVGAETADMHRNPRTLEQLVDVAAPILWEGSAHGEDALAKLAKMMEVVGPDKRLFDLSTTDVGKVIFRLRELGKTPGTINRYISAFHRVLAWGNAKGRDYVPVLPAFEWQDEDESQIFVISQAKEAEMLRYLRGWGRDDIADFIQVALDTGCRRRELLSAQPDLLSGDWLTLWADQTRTTIARAVPLTPRAKSLLQCRLPWLFTAAQLRYWFDKAKQAMGLAAEGAFVIHACRHTCATRLVEAGVNLRVIQRWLGHKNLATTARYAKSSDEMLLRAAASLSAAFPPPISATRHVSSQNRLAWKFSSMLPDVRTAFERESSVPTFGFPGRAG